MREESKRRKLKSVVQMNLIILHTEVNRQECKIRLIKSAKEEYMTEKLS